MTEPEHASLLWRKSSASQDNTGCVEVAVDQQHVYVRNSRDACGPALAFLPHEWEAFITGVHNGEFNLPGPETN